MRRFVMSRNRASVIACLIGLLPLTARALIYHEGKIVSEWPEEARPLPKAGSDGAAAPFYNNPKGTIWGLTLLVDFPDQASPFPIADVKDWLNLKGFNKTGCNGSVRDYYADVSNGKLDFQNEVYGFYRAKNPKTYYDGGSGQQRATELLNEMIAYFDPLVDFSKFDNDKDGKTESISIVYAGVGKTWGQGIWPHAGGLNRNLDGVTAGRYMMTDLGNRFTLYVFAHEVGHMLFGWPDLYYFGDYCLMGNRIQDQNPVAINDFYRADQGWIPVEDVDRGTNANLALPSGKAGCRYVNPAKPNELFFWSNLANTGRWSGLRGKGLILYHFDKSKGGNGSGQNRSLFVVEADGANNLAGDQWPSPGSSAADFFPYGGKTEFSAQTAAAGSRWNDGSASGLRIYNIGAAGDPMTFTVGTGVAAAFADPRPKAAAVSVRGHWFDLKGARHGGSAPRWPLLPAPGR
jgi:M6 family metalloprotease-like protein